MMLGRDGIAGLSCLVVSLWLLALTWGLPPAAMVPLGPAVYPRVVLSLMAVLSIALIAFDLRARRRLANAPAGEMPAVGPAAKPSVTAYPNYPLVLATFILFGLYIAAIPGLGFRIATFLFMAALQVTLEWPRSWPRWLLVLAVALATAIACHVVFEDYLSVLLPRGRWSGM